MNKSNLITRLLLLTLAVCMFGAEAMAQGCGGQDVSFQYNLPVAVPCAMAMYNQKKIVVTGYCHDSVGMKAKVSVWNNYHKFTTGLFGPDTSVNVTSPEAAAFDSAGNLYIVQTERTDSNILIFNDSMRLIQVISNDTADSTHWFNPRGICFDSAWNLYIVSQDSMDTGTMVPNSGKLIKITYPLTTALKSVVLTGLDNPTSVVMRDSNLYIAEFSANKISRYKFPSLVKVDSAIIDSPVDMVSTGCILYISEHGTNSVKVYQADSLRGGVVVTIHHFDTGYGPLGILLDNYADIYIADNKNNQVVVYPYLEGYTWVSAGSWTGTWSGTGGGGGGGGYTWCTNCHWLCLSGYGYDSITVDTGGTWYNSDTAVLILDSMNIAGTAATFSISPHAAGTDTLIYTHASVHDTFYITVYDTTLEPSPLSIYSFGSGDSYVYDSLEYCIGRIAALMDSSDGGYWSSSNTAVAMVRQNGTVWAKSAGYTIITYGYTGGACSRSIAATFKIIVDFPAGPVSPVSPLCVGDSVMLSDAVTGGTWSLSNTDATLHGSELTAISSGGTEAIYTMVNGCGTTSKSTPVTINPAANPGVISGITVVCLGTSSTLTDSATGGTWNITNGNATLAGTVVTGSHLGIDTVYYAVSGVCGDSSAFVTIEVVPTVNAGIITGTNTVCAGFETTLSDTLAGGMWSTTDTNATVTSGIVQGIYAGTDTVYYTINSTCGVKDTFLSITIDPATTISLITGSTTVCTGATTTLFDSTAGGVWTASNVNAIVSAGVVTGSHTGTDSIVYVVTNSCGTVTTTATITILPLPYAGNISGIMTVCTGTLTTLTDSVSGGLWLASNGNASVTGGLVTGISAGADSILYRVSNICGSDTTAAVITISTIPASAGDITGILSVCQGGISVLSDAVIGGVWSTTGAGVHITGGSVAGTAAGEDSIFYTVHNTCGNRDTFVVFTVFGLPAVAPIAGVSDICPGAITTLTDATTGGFWLSSDSDVVIDGTTGIANGTTAGIALIYYIIGPDSNGCYDTANYTITVIPTPQIEISESSSPIPCFGGTGVIYVSVTGGSGNYKYLWSQGDTTESITGVASGSYHVLISDRSSQCSVGATYAISQPARIETASQVKNDPCRAGNGAISLMATGGTPPYTYEWHNNDTGSYLHNLALGAYTVKITDHNNCIAYDTVEIIEGLCNTLTVHEALTPNNDGINDEWVIDGILDYPNCKIKVFDKEGNLKYETTGYSNTWKGDGLPAGTYYYMIQLNPTIQQQVSDMLTGFVCIVR